MTSVSKCSATCRAPASSWSGVAHYLPHFTGPNGIRGGFQHYGAMVEDGKANRARGSSRGRRGAPGPASGAGS
ncbi:hypothetical protein AB0878_35600 [Amycolatopsis sp. NPDC047767]|uniref:hypothetical protein n=1 Tax=Amycolatopsis sp. NPDC047767 TaxID=3156765 RepID=UPI003454973E